MGVDKSQDLFSAGVLSALSIIRLHGEDTIFDEIVEANGSKELLKEARRNGIMQWSGMSKYLRRRAGRG